MVQRLNVVDLKSEARQYTATALNCLKNICSNEQSPPAARVAAATAILDRGWGKPQLQVEQTHNVTLNIAAEHVKILKSLADLREPITIDAVVDDRLQIDVANGSTQVIDDAAENDQAHQPR